MSKIVTAAVLCSTLIGGAAGAMSGGDDAVRAIAAGDGIQLAGVLDHAGGTLSVSAPDGTVSRHRFGPADTPTFRADGGLADGVYSWELVLSPRLTAEERTRLREARAAGVDPVDVPQGRVLSGTFAIAAGTLAGGLEESGAPIVRGGAVANGILAPEDQVIPDDLIVQQSLCVGFDCVNGESFGFDTIRMKENSTRIKFDDTSTGAGFPANDWQLTANDSASGGQNKFSIEDITGARVPFTIEAGSTTNSVYVDSTGRVGFRTSTPVLDLHVATSNTPAIRLEQNSSGGFTAQTWDIAGNEANFFVRDVTSGSRLPFRIRPGAPTSSLDISANGDVGVGTASPAATLHVSGSDGDTQLRVIDTNGTAAVRTLLDLRNNGDVQFILRNTNSGENWQFLAFNNGFQISEVATTNVFSFLEGGNMQIPGMYTSTSDRAAKKNILAVDPLDVLAKVVQLPIATWSYKHQGDESVHMGPMAQDFFSLFGLGDDDKRIAVTDPSGVALAAIQGLYQQVQDRNSAIESLRQENAELEARLARLEALLKN